VVEVRRIKEKRAQACIHSGMHGRYLAGQADYRYANDDINGDQGEERHIVG
jgi:hypothetical protein